MLSMAAHTASSHVDRTSRGHVRTPRLYNVQQAHLSAVAKYSARVIIAFEMCTCVYAAAPGVHDQLQEFPCKR